MSDLGLLARATLVLYRDAARDGTRALAQHLWVILVLPGYSLVLGLIGSVAGGLGFAGGFLLYLGLAAALSSFLTILEGAVARERVRPSELAPSFGRYLWSIASVFLVFWLIQLLLSLIAEQNPGLGWLAIAVNAGVFLVCNPLPEMIYQGSRDGFPLIDDAIQFTRENALEWLVPVALLLAPVVAVDLRAALLAMAELGPSSALPLVMEALGWLLPGMNGAGQLLLPFLASAALLWVMLFRGFLFRALARSGRRQRIFEARMRGL